MQGFRRPTVGVVVCVRVFYGRTQARGSYTPAMLRSNTLSYKDTHRITASVIYAFFVPIIAKPIPFSFTNHFYLPYGRRTGGYAGSCQPGRGNIYIIFYSDLGERAVRYGFERRAFYVMSRRIRDGLAASLFHNNEVGDGTSFINTYYERNHPVPSPFSEPTAVVSGGSAISRNLQRVSRAGTAFRKYRRGSVSTHAVRPSSFPYIRRDASRPARGAHRDRTHRAAHVRKVAALPFFGISCNFFIINSSGRGSERRPCGRLFRTFLCKSAESMIKTTRKFRKISWFPERTESKVLRPVPVLSYVLPSGDDSAGHEARAVFLHGNFITGIG